MAFTTGLPRAIAGFRGLAAGASLGVERMVNEDQRHMRLTFFDSHFASFNRQVMLVDVLSAVYAGRTAFEDTTRAVSELGAALRYGTNTVATCRLPNGTDCKCVFGARGPQLSTAAALSFTT